MIRRDYTTFVCYAVLAGIAYICLETTVLWGSIIAGNGVIVTGVWWLVNRLRYWFKPFKMQFSVGSLRQDVPNRHVDFLIPSV